MSDKPTDMSQYRARQEITRSVMSLLDLWRLNSDQMQRMLCLPSDIKARAFNKFREGREVLPNDRVVMRRAVFLLRIADALRTAYPTSPQMAETWIHQPHHRFNRKTPLQMILQNQSETGLITVLSELDCSFSWDLAASKLS